MYISVAKENSTKYYVSAILFHIIVLAFFYSLSVLFNLKRTPIQLNTEIEQVKAAVRIDVVAMPKLTLQELEKLEVNQKEPEEQTEKAQAVNETSDVEFKQVKKKISMQDLLSKYSEKKVEGKKAKTKKITADLKKIILEGNKLSQGSSTTGENTDQVNEAFVGYIQGIPDVVRPYWKLPSYLLEKDLRCRLRIFLSAAGKVLKIEIFESSGELEYDNKAIDAVQKASPFPKPPTQTRERVLRGDLILGFPL